MRNGELSFILVDRSNRRWSLALLVLLVLPARTPADDQATPPTVDYLRDVRPVLEKRCFACHGALKQEGGLRLDTGELLRKGGDSGPAGEPGSPDGSLIIERVSDPDPETRMPPEGEPLGAEQIASLQAWIAQGALSPPDERPEPDPDDHWAFRSPVRKSVPTAGAAASANPIDSFLASERERNGVSPLPSAEPHVLLRRVYLDLIGLPPTRDQLQEFLADPSDEAYARVVERLLADPRHGERWARHWMDVWRYSDWYGRRGVPDVLNSYGMIWRWRDWIVRSLNDDRSYAQMVQMMLAADELAPANDADLVATGFLARNFFRWNYDSWKKDNVEHVGKAFLGLTLNCAHCHDHKYDPITHEDYFRFRAFFEPIELRQDRVPGEPDPGPYPKYEYGKAYPPITSGMVRVIDEKLEAETYLYTRGEARNIVPGRPPIAPGVPSFLDNGSFRIEPIDLPPEAYYPGLKSFVQQEEIAVREAALAAAEQSIAAAQHSFESASEEDAEAARLTLVIEQANLTHAKSELSAIQARVNADRVRYGKSAGDPVLMAHAAAKAEREAAASRAATDVARAERALFDIKRKAEAEPSALGEVMAAEQHLAATRATWESAEAAIEEGSTSYTPLGPSYSTQSTGRRAALAQWVTGRENPLTARVAVNHVWRWHFGKPLVATTADFGRNGKLPTHPELLDWLAVEFMDGGWNFKALHRLIVTSAAYRMQSQSADLSSSGRSIDPENRCYWRFETTRMEAEVVRDALLQVARQLNCTIGGPDVDQAQGLSSRRRTLYLTHHGEARMTFLELFDAPDPCDCYQRSESVIPQQALALTNNEMLVTLSNEIEARLWSSIAAAQEEPDGAFITAAFEEILSRPPTPAERQLTEEFLARQPLLFSREETSVSSPEQQAIRARRGLIRALFSHNDFITIR